MLQSTEEVKAALDAFVPDDDVANVHRLHTLFEGFPSLPRREKAMPAMFGLLERFPEAELGTPGPLVHEVEAIEGYEALLEQSLKRQPTYLTVWMVNRILNGSQEQTPQEYWLSQLRAVLENPNSPEHVRAAASGFIEHQKRRQAQQTVQADGPASDGPAT